MTLVHLAVAAVVVGGLGLAWFDGLRTGRKLGRTAAARDVLTAGFAEPDTSRAIVWVRASRVAASGLDPK